MTTNTVSDESCSSLNMLIRRNLINIELVSTHWGRDEMVVIMQVTILNVLS